MTFASRVCMLAALAAVIAAPAASATSSRPAAAQTDPKVLHIVTDMWGIELTPATVAPARYTVQVLNIGEYPVRVTIGKLVDVTVEPNGWKFKDVLFKAGVSYKVHAVAPLDHLAWDAVLSSQ